MLKVAAVQLEPEFHDIEANLEKIKAKAVEARDAGARLIVFPELATTGYTFDSREEAFALGDELPGGTPHAPLRRRQPS